MEKGILYVATKAQYLEEAIQSVKTIKKVGISLPIAIYVTKDLELEARNYFDIICIIGKPHYSFIDKILPLADSPFQKTLFLDGDTKIYEDITNLFDVLDRYDISFTYAPIRNLYKLSSLPDWFLEPNTGVLLFKKTDKFIKFVADWHRIYLNQMRAPIPPTHDQPSFRSALFNSDISCYVLGEEYNFRTIFPCALPGNSSIKIFHDRLSVNENDLLYKLSSNINGNNYITPKVYLPNIADIRKTAFIIEHDKLKPLQFSALHYYLDKKIELFKHKLYKIKRYLKRF